MITDLTVCSDSTERLSYYSDFLSDLKIISFKKIGSYEFISGDFDIITLPTSLAHPFGARHQPLDCQNLEKKNADTKNWNVNNFPNLITNVPNFNNIVDDYTELEMAFLSFSIPLNKVNNFSNERNISLRYGIFDEYSFACSGVNDDLMTKVRNEFISVFNVKD